MASLRIFLMVMALALMPAVVPAAPPDPEFLDLWQTVMACKLLQDDDVLAPLNLGVKVRGRVAVLWGPVPSVAMSLRAEARLRAMIELIDVQNELIVMPEAWSDGPVPASQPPQFLPEKSPPPLPGLPRPLLRNLGEPRPGIARL